MSRNFLLIIAISSVVLVAAGFGGGLHRSMDTLALGRPLFGLACLIGIFATGSILLRLLFCSTAILAIGTIVVFLIPQDDGKDLRVYSKNLWFWNDEIPAVVADIEAAQVDVVMLQEVSKHNVAILDQLQNSFPYQHVCRFSEWLGAAVLSRYPIDGRPKCSIWRAMAAAPIRINNERVWIVSAHVPWPWPLGSSRNEQAAVILLNSLEGKIVVAGDFNTFPWTGRISRIARITDTKVAGPVTPTMHILHIPLPLDLVLAPEGGSIAKRPLLGSDHAGLVADVGL